MENRWAEADGYGESPPRVRYLIRDRKSDEVVEHLTVSEYDHGRGRHYLSLAPEDQEFAEEIVTLIQRACAYFYAPDEKYEPLEGVPDLIISDDDVLRRIERLEKGENTREAERSGKGYYPLTDLPFDQQRALVEQIEVLKIRWQFQILGELQQMPQSA